MDSSQRRSLQIAATSSKEQPRRSLESYSEEQWEEMYSLLQQYYEVKGHCRVPKKYKTKCGTWLGNWLMRQKQYHRAGTLTAERWERLQDLGVSHLTRYEERWEEMYNLLLQFKEREGHLQVRQKHVEDGEKLGYWLARQRNNHKKGILNSYRAERLDEYFRTWIPIRPDAGFEPNEELWEEKFNLLLQFKEREGHLDVPQSHKEDGKTLGRWVSRQRDLQKKGILDEDRKQRLMGIGISWDLTYLKLERWEAMYDLLLQFKEREGHPNVLSSHKEDGEDLGVWLNDQRKAYRKGILEVDRERQLQDIGVSWHWQNDHWEEMYNLLVQFKEREGHSNVPRRHEEDGENLGQWLSKQRQFRKKGTLKTDRREKLDSLGIAWDGRTKTLVRR